MIHRKQNITLKGLADELDLSVSTVSRALNNHPDISSATKQRVQNLAKELNYIPNLFAKGFRTHHTRILGVIVPNVSHYFTTTILKGILDTGEQLGYRIIICESKNDEKKQTEMLQTILQFGAEGILLALARRTKSIDGILRAMQRIPVVLFDKVSDKIPCTQVVIDEEVAAYMAVEHLINTGKRRIAIIKETENSYNSEKRYAGYLKALRDNDLSVDEKIVLSTEDISMEKGNAMANILLSLKHRPDAVFAITDSSAIGVIQALNAFKIKIPEEIAVVGFSNSIHSTIISPSLSTVDQPGEKIGSTALKALIDEIEHPKVDFISKTIEVKTSLIVRESSFVFSASLT
ncbi:MAG: LacI family DNA-binding transcriptional regulator [Bacteroidota bacterium]